MSVILFLDCVSAVDVSTQLDLIHVHATLVHDAIRQLTSVKVSSVICFIMAICFSKNSCPENGSGQGLGPSGDGSQSLNETYRQDYAATVQCIVED